LVVKVGRLIVKLINPINLLSVQKIYQENYYTPVQAYVFLVSK